MALLIVRGRVDRKSDESSTSIGVKKNIEKSSTLPAKPKEESTARDRESLEPLEIQMLVHMAGNYVYDTSARGLAIDFHLNERRMQYHFDRLLHLGMVRDQGFVRGGGYVLTENARRFLVENNLI